MIKLLRFVSLQFVLFLGLTVMWIPVTYAEDSATPMREQAESERSGENIIAIVNGVGIKTEDLEAQLEKKLPRQFHDRSIQKLNKMGITKRKILDKLIMQELLYQEATKQKIAVDSDVIKGEVDKLTGKYSKEKLKEILEKNNLTIAEISEIIKRQQLIKNIAEKMQKEFNQEAKKIVNDTYIEDYYKNNPEQFKMPQKIRLREILIRVDPGAGKEGWREAQERTNKIRKRIEEGEAFEDLAKKLSDDKYAEMGGDMGFVHMGSLIPEVGEHIPDMEIGELLGPIWTLYGFHLFKLEEKTPSEMLDLSLVKASIEKSRIASEEKRLNKEWRNKMRSEAEVIIFK